MDTTLVIFIVLGFCIVILLIISVRLEMRMRKFFMGTEAKNLEGVLVALGRHAEQLEQTQKEINAHLQVVDSKLRKTVRNVETLRFNPFPDAGGNQSFAIGLLDEEGDGVVLSSLYARDRMSVFAKPIDKGIPIHDLTEEEDNVLQKVKHKNGKQK